MITRLTVSDLKRFENRVADTFNEGHIRAPVHLYSGNEENVIRVFQGRTEGCLSCDVYVVNF